MRIKIFQKNVKSGYPAAISQLEDDINDWLGENTDIDVLDMQFSTNSSTIEAMTTLLTVVCVILYKRRF